MGICDGRSRALTMGLTGSAIVVGNLLLAAKVEAQNAIVPDSTLGIEASVVVPSTNAPIDVIDGGAIRGQNLFHSFSEFNIGEGRGAYFFSPTAEIQTIFSRVTGVDRSDILGTLGTIGNSAPDLWLINPNGILFGPNASLDLGGSFVATTANAIQVDESTFFPASAAPENTQILSIGSSVFFLDALSDARITTQSQPTVNVDGFINFGGLGVLEGRAIGLISQNIDFDGASVNAPNGEIFLLSTDTINLENDANVIGGNVTVEADQVSVQDGSRLLAQFSDIARLGNNLQVSPGNILLPNPDEIQGLPTLSGGNLSIVARESIDVSGTTPDEQISSLIGTNALGLLSSGGNLSIQTPHLTIQDGGQISSNYISVSENNEGGGNISITASSVNVLGESSSGLQPSRLYIGNSPFSPTDGSIFIQADEFSLLDGAILGSNRIDQLVELKIDQSISDSIVISSPSILVSGISETGRPSTILSNQTDFLSEQVLPIIFDSETINVQLGSQVSGDIISVRGNSLTVQDNSLIFGNIEIRGDNVTVQNTAWIVGNFINISGSSSKTENSVVLRDQSILFAGETDILDDGTFILLSPEDGDAINIIADSLRVSGNSSIIGNIITFSGTDIVLQHQAQVRADEPEYGSGGNIDISTNFLRVLDSAQLSASVAGTGEGGDINIVAEGFVELTGDPLSPEPSSISATLGGPGTGGQISIDTGSLTVHNGSQITTRVNGGGSGGNINISARGAVTVQGTSSNGRPSSISTETDLNGGEFGILRHIKFDQESRDSAFLLLESTAPQFFIGEGVLYAIPGRADEIFGEENIVPFETINEADLFREGSLRVVRTQVVNNTFLDQPPFGLLVNSRTTEGNLLPNGLFMIGQSFGTDFNESISGGQLLDLSQNIQDFEKMFLSGFEESESFLLESLALSSTEEMQSDFDELDSLFGDEATQARINELNSLRESFESGAGEFYVVESTGREFRIQDSTFTDTRFLNIQPGDLFLIFAVRDGGDINISTGNLIVRDGAQITANSLGAAQGDAAASNLTINAANSVSVDNNSSIAATASTGSGGNLSIQTSELQLTNNSILSAAARANASGGRIAINTTGDVRAVNSDILTDSEQAGGGGIEINARDIYLEGDSDLRTNVAAGEGDGGNITLSGRYIFAFDDSDILADAEGGRGGNIQLNVRGFFGESFTLDSLNADPDTLDGNNRVDVNATGTVNGVVEIPDINFIENSVTTLPDAITPADQILAGSCISRAGDDQGSFVVTGGGGLPTRPTTGNVVSTYPTGEVQSPSTASQAQWQPGDAIVEPTGVYELDDGRLVLSQECDDN